MNELDAVIRRALDRAGLGSPRYSTLELVRGDPAGDVRALLVFVDGRADPSVFVKLDAGTHGRRLQAEYRNLEALQRAESAAVRESVPRPLLLDSYGAFTVMAQTALPGRRMKDFAPETYFASRRFSVHFDDVVDWTSEFDRSLAPGLPPAGPDAPADVRRFRDAYRRSPGLDRLIDDSVDLLARDRPPPAPTHGDFCTANILVSKDERIRVVDWELALEAGWPLADLLYFVASVWCIRHGRGAEIRERNFRAVFFESTPLTDRLNDGIRRSAHDRSLHPEMVLPLSVLAWITYANRKRQALGLDGPPSDALSESHFPLVMVRDGYCRNLELIAELRDRYLPARAKR